MFISGRRQGQRSPWFGRAWWGLFFSFLSSHTFHRSLFSYALRRFLWGQHVCHVSVFPGRLYTHSSCCCYVLCFFLGYSVHSSAFILFSLTLAKALGGVIHSWENMGLGVYHGYLSFLFLVQSKKNGDRLFKITDFVSFLAISTSFLCYVFAMCYLPSVYSAISFPLCDKSCRDIYGPKFLSMGSIHKKSRLLQ